MEEMNLGDFTPLISIEEIEKILFQMKNSVCKVYKNDIYEIGFLCKIPFPYHSNLIPVLITNNYILSENEINNDSIIKIILNNEEKEIKMDKSRKKYFSLELDITIIEIKPDKDKININNFIEIDEEEILENNYKNKLIYMLKYQNEKAKVLFGLINDNIINEMRNVNINNFTYSLIFSLNTFKIIGFNYNNKFNNKKKKETLIKYILNEFYKNNINNKKNEIRMIIKIEEKDVNKEIYFLDNTKEHNNLKELKKDNVDLFINNKKETFQKYFYPNNTGNYSIKLIFENYITDCSYMFNKCINLISIDLSSFNTKNITEMSYMFSHCENLKDINLSSCDTQNAINMNFMFYCCYKLKDINLSSFVTKNVKNINGIFFYCKNLTNIDLSSFDIKNIIGMSYILSYCKNLKTIIINKQFYEKINKEINSNSKIIFS